MLCSGFLVVPFSFVLLSSAPFPAFKEAKILKNECKNLKKWICQKSGKKFRKAANPFKTEFQMKIFHPTLVTVLNRSALQAVSER